MNNLSRPNRAAQADMQDEQRIAISVIIPTLNEEKILARTLALFTNELKIRFALEVIVSDGGSTDQTLAIAEQYADAVRYHTSPVRQRIAEGRNAGAALAQGAVLVFLNADTVPAHPEALFEAVLDWQKNRSIREAARKIAREVVHEVALACPVEIAPEERRISDRIFHGFFNRYVRCLNALGIGMGRGECQIVCAEAFRAVGGYNEQIAAGEDFDLYRRLRLEVGTIGWNSRCVVYESPRRFRKYGYLHVLQMWFVNALSVMLRNRAVSEEWEVVR